MRPLALPTAPRKRPSFAPDALAAGLLGWLASADEATSLHCRRVAVLSLWTGRELGLQGERLRLLWRAALLHDVGKMTLPRNLLCKNGGLNDEECATMRGHSRAGHDILRGAGLREEARIVLHHHERPDAAGYPCGIAGAAIPLESRIILAADAFDAMTSDRPYRAARPGAEALLELERCTGTQFDPACVRALRRRLTRPVVA